REGNESVERGDFNKAVECYEAALDGTMLTAEAHYRLGLVYEDKLKNEVAALHHFERYLELAPQGQFGIPLHPDGHPFTLHHQPVAGPEAGRQCDGDTRTVAKIGCELTAQQGKQRADFKGRFFRTLQRSVRKRGGGKTSGRRPGRRFDSLRVGGDFLRFQQAIGGHNLSQPGCIAPGSVRMGGLDRTVERCAERCGPIARRQSQNP
ncbi:MAG: tetratricopeptide repeat protein, partial [Caulobacteraceae bacterium]|nr:tetratricopeptide repeat protein [Caulobacteraceae bacterium]